MKMQPRLLRSASWNHNGQFVGSVFRIQKGKSMRKILIALFGVTMLAACGQEAVQNTAPPPAEVASAEAIAGETARVNEWFATRFEEQIDFSPITKTFLGRSDDNDKIDDFSEAGEEAQLLWRKRTVEDLKGNFDYNLLTPEAKISYDIWVYELERAEDAVPFRRRGYVFTQMQGTQSFLPNFLINFHKVESDADMQAYITRIGGVSRAIDQLV